MTKPIPNGAPRQRQARVCVQCRNTKVKCINPVLPLSDEGTALKPCERCKIHGFTCEFTKSKRMGRPRRLLKMIFGGEEEEIGGEGVGKISPSGSGVGSGNQEGGLIMAAPYTVPSLPTPTSTFTNPSTLAERYLQEIHAWLPIFPPSLPFISTHLSSHPTLSLSLTCILSAPTPIPISFDSLHLQNTLPDAQASLFFFHYFYGQGEAIISSLFLDWCYDVIKEKKWYTTNEGREDGVEREMGRRCYWEGLSAEVMFAVNTGTRDLKIGELNLVTEVTEEDNVLFGQTTFPLFIRSLTLLRDLINPSLQPSPQEYSLLISLSQSLISESSTSFHSSCLTLDLSPLPPSNQAQIKLSDEQSFMSFLLASTALVNVLCSAASNASSGFLCGLDGTVVQVQGFPLIEGLESLSLGDERGEKKVIDAREIIQQTCSNIFSFLSTTLSTPFASRPHSPFYGCSLMTAATGFIATLKGDGIPPTILELSSGNEGSKDVTRENLELVMIALEGEAKKWKVAEDVRKAMESIRVGFFWSGNGEEAKELAEGLVRNFD